MLQPNPFPTTTLVSRTPAPVLREQYAACVRRGYPSLKPRPRAPIDRPLAIVARGPSAPWHLHSIPDHADVMSLKACELLGRAGIKPKYAVHVDPQASEARHVANAGGKILVSSQCHPAVFNALDRRRVVTFSARVDQFWAPPMPVSAGANVTAHALFLAVLLGYRDIHIIGSDCDFGDGDKYYHSGGDLPDDVATVRAYNGRSYRTTPALQGFADEITHTARLLSKLKGANFHIYGNSLLAVTATLPRETYYLDEGSALCWLPYSSNKSNRVIDPLTMR